MKIATPKMDDFDVRMDIPGAKIDNLTAWHLNLIERFKRIEENMMTKSDIQLILNHIDLRIKEAAERSRLARPFLFPDLKES